MSSCSCVSESDMRRIFHDVIEHTAYLNLTHNYEVSKERVRLIAARVLADLDIDPNTLRDVEPLLAKKKIRILYRAGAEDLAQEVDIEDEHDIEQLEIYRVNKSIYDRTPHSIDPKDGGGCCLL